MFIRYLILSIITIVVIGAHPAIANQSVHIVEESIKKHASHFLSDKRINSVSIGVVKGSDVYTQHFGELTSKMGNAPDNNTYYEIGSVSKAMTGLLTAKAVKEGKLLLDVNITEYLSEPLSQLSPDNNPVTVRQLLTHTSGIPKGREDLNIDRKSLTRKAFISALNTIDTSKNKHHFNYSSAGVELLAYILETVYQTPFDSLLQKTLYQEASMTTTKVNLSKSDMKSFAYGYNDKNELMPAHTAIEILWGSGGYIKSTMADLTRFIQLQLNRNNDTVQLSQQKLYHVSGRDSMSYLWIAVDEDDRKTHFVHHGGLEGTQYWLMVFPEYNIGISVITNSSFPQTASMLQELAFKIIDDIKPFGKKSINLALNIECQKDVDACLKKYQQLKSTQYSKYYFEKPAELNTLGYSLLNTGHVSSAIKVFTLLINEFPNDANAYDSLGETYFNNNNYPQAIIHLNKALLLNPNNGNAKKMLLKMKGET